MTKKSFFKERSVAGIRKLDLANAFTANGLVTRINGLDEDKGIVLRTDILPVRFTRNVATMAEASRKAYKHGEYMVLSQPKTQGEAFACRDIPLAIRQEDFAKLEEMDERENFLQGYSFRPVQGRDRRKRVVPFAWILEGARLFGYAETVAHGIKVEPYDDARRVKREGAEVVCTVPSREQKKGRYKVKLNHVPTEGSTERRAVAWSLMSECDGESPENKIYNIKYNFENDREGSNVATFYPSDIAAYYATIKKYWGDHNITPLEMTPIALPSRQAAEFYTKLNNNMLIYDPTITSSKDKLRKLHVAEKSILIARAVGKFGADAIMYADGPRDGKLESYDWKGD